MNPESSQKAYQVILFPKRHEIIPRRLDGKADMEARIDLTSTSAIDLAEELRLHRLRNLHLTDQGQPEQISRLFSVLSTEQEHTFQTRVYIERVLHDQLIDLAPKAFPEQKPASRNERIDCVNDWLQKKVISLLEKIR